MYAKLVSHPNFNPALGNSVGDRLKEISDVVTGVIHTANISSLQTFDTTASTIVDTTPSGWSLVYANPGTFAFPASTAATVIWTAPSLLSNKPKFFKLTSTATSTLITGFCASLYTSSGIATNETNVNHSGWALTTLPVLYIKATSRCLLFYVINNDANSATNEPDIIGVLERSTFAYDAATIDSPQVYVSINQSDSITGAKVPYKYNPALDSYSPTVDVSTRFKQFATTGSAPSITRDVNSRVSAPFIHLLVDDLSTGWVGGNLSEHTGFFRTADNLGRPNDAITQDSNTYRVWVVGNYRYIVQET